MHSAISTLSDTRAALREASAAVTQSLGGEPDVILVFTSPHHAASWSRLPAIAQELLPHTQVFGCSGAGVIGDGHEIEQRCALSIFAMRIQGLQASCRHLDPSEIPALAPAADAGSRPVIDIAPWRAILPGDAPTLTIVLADPLSTDVVRLLPGISARWPESPIVGGLASGSQVVGGHALFGGGRCHRIGALVITLRGAITVDTIVAQGCRPIGDPMLVTRCRGRMIQEIGDERPVTILRALYAELPETDQALFRHSLFVGIEMRGDQEEYRQGDFQVRRITGMDPNNGAITLEDEVERWQVVQFQLRDPRTAERELRAHLMTAPHTADAVLMFTCTGRGLHLFGRPDHDTDLVRERFGDVTLAGLFCAGEIGPVGDTSFLHRSTTVLVLLRGDPDAG